MTTEKSQYWFDEFFNDKLKYHIGVLMREDYELRKHINKNKLARKVREKISDASYESIFRAQRKLWETAEREFQAGRKDMFYNFIPYRQEDYIEWCRIRKQTPLLYVEAVHNG